VPITVVLADDHQIVREGLRALLKGVPDVRLIGEAADGHEALRLVEQLRPQVLVADLMMPGLPGFELTRLIRRKATRTQVVVLSMHADAPYVLEALRSGALAYVVKDAGADQLVQAIRAAAEGKRYLSPPLSESALGAFGKHGKVPEDPFETLTAREREVLRLTAEGLSGSAVAEQLFISPRTVETHRANIMRKLGVKNQKELIRYAVQCASTGPFPARSRNT
jgi:two-component system, NarL family, response regulator NreC